MPPISPSFNGVRRVGNVGDSYHQQGPVIQVVHGNGVVVTQELDVAGRLAVCASSRRRMPSTALRAWLRHSPPSRLVKGSTGFTLAQQLQQIQDFTYDVYGNLTEMKTEGVPVSAMSVNAATNRVTTLGYDEAGNVTRWQPPGSSYERQYAYDALSRLVKESTPTSSNVTYHVYTASDERYWSYSDQNGTVESHFTLRGLGNEVLRDFRLAGTTWTVSRDYVYRDGTLLASLTPTQAQHISVDHLGTPRLITNDQRYRIGAHTYQPYGAEWTDGTPQEGDVLKFTGHERDRSLIGSESNALDYMHARYYSGGMGRFLSVDPLLGNLPRPASWNRYAYVLASPLNLIDPFGLTERNPGEKMDDGDTCNGTVVDGWCTGETIVVSAPYPQLHMLKSAAADFALRDALLRQQDVALSLAKERPDAHERQGKSIPEMWHCVEGVMAPFVVAGGAFVAGGYTAYGGYVAVQAGVAAAPETAGVSLVATGAGVTAIAAGGWLMLNGVSIAINHTNNIFGTSLPSPSQAWPQAFPQYPPANSSPCGH